MNVLFLNPSRAGEGNIPLNIPLMIAVLKKHNHEVRLFDMSDYAVFSDSSSNDMFFKKAEFDFQQIVDDRKQFYKDKFGTVVTGCNLKETDYHKDFEEVINDFRPNIIAVSCLSTDFDFAINFLFPFKKKFNIPVIFGGIHAVLLPEETLSAEACDFVCIGEGENSFVDFLTAIEKNLPLESVKGIWFKKNKKIIKNPPINLTNLEELPIPDYECFDPIHFYRPFDGKKYKMVNYEVSRGCPFSCTYCVNGILKLKYRGLGPYHRVKNIKQSISELKLTITKYSFNFVRFWDEDFTSLREEFLKRYCEEYLKEIDLPFLIYSRVDTVTQKKVGILKKMGCRTFAMGIESGNEIIRRNVMNRQISNKLIIEKFNLVKSYDIRTSAYNIIGLPHETREAIFDTIELNRQINPDSFSVTLLEPYKGTPIREMCEEQGLDPNYKTTFGGVQFVPKSMSAEGLQGLFRTFAFYIKFPRDRYDEIRKAEKDNEVYKKLSKEFAEKFL
ncbi:MAG: hypothetical protein FD151_970 [bacterium]|nr:MAG: hypothetical protein FD151_970 [bacterium]